MGTPSNDLNISQPGYVTFDGVATFNGRTFQAGTGITLLNADGIAGNTTITSTASQTDLHVAEWIVNSSPNSGGNQLTIQAAINIATSGDTIFVMPGATGTYTENLTLKAGVNIVAFNGDQVTPNVTIIGNATFSAAGTVSISNIRLQTTGAAALTVSGSAASIVNLNNCFFNCTNNTGISFTSSSASAMIFLDGCRGDLTTTGIAFFASSSAGRLLLNNTNLNNSGGSTTANTVSAGAINATNCSFLNPITTSGATGSSFVSCAFLGSSLNTTPLTLGGSGTHDLHLSLLTSGTAAALSVGATVACYLCTFIGSNANLITGAGTFVYADIVYGGTSNGNNVTTLTRRVTDGGEYKGSTTNTAPSAGMIGEQISNTATAVANTTGTPKTVTSISLTAGIWDVSAMATALPSGGTGQMGGFLVAISTTDNTITGTAGINYFQLNVTSTALSGVVPVIRASLTGTTTYYCVSQPTFSATNCPVNGRITATRVA